jgi:hypothetical protein
MKKLKLALILMTTIFLFSCEKDEQGRILKYYKHVTGEGYVFYKYLDGSIAPSPHQEVEVTAKLHPNGGLAGFNMGNTQKVKTDINGKYSCRFVKTVDGWEMNGYNFGHPTDFIFDDAFTAAGFYFSCYRTGFTINFILPIIEKASKTHPQIVYIDTVWLIQKNTH